MKQFLPALLKAFLMLFLLQSSLQLNAQIVAQDFEMLSTVQDWVNAASPANRVNKIENNPDVYFELGSNAGDRFLRLVKANSQQNSQQAFFLKDTDFPEHGLLKLQFDLSVTAAQGVQGVLGSFYLGRNLGQTAFFPDNANRFATIDLNFAGGNSFQLANANGPNQREKTGVYTGEARVTIILNATNIRSSYLAPNGEIASIGSKKVSIWVGSQEAIQDAIAQAGTNSLPITALKFSTRNNALEGTLSLDNFLVEPLKPTNTKFTLPTAGGTFTVGPGGQFTSLTNPGGVFEALNAIQGPIGGAYIFRITGDLLGETGAVALNEVNGASSSNTIQFTPQDNAHIYTISGENTQAQGALIRFNGADWVVFDGRSPENGGQGVNAGRYLVIRNAGTAPTFQLQADATNNILSYLIIQGASSVGTEGVVFLANGAATGNDDNTFLFNRIGGYGQEHPLNALVSVNTSASLTENLFIRGNQFYSFGHQATQSFLMPCAVLAGSGSSNWRIQDNSFFQEGTPRPITAQGEYSMQAVCINAGVGHKVQTNFVGGTATRAGGSRLKAETSGEPGSYPSIVPFRVDAPGGVVDIIGNTVKNIDVTGTPFVLCDALAMGSLALDGEVNFTENIFGDPLSSNTSQIIARTRGAGDANLGGYMVAPIYYRAETGKMATGKVVGNRIGSVQLDGSFDGTGIADIKFVGILTGPTAVVSQINDNTIANVRSRASGNIGVSMTGILSMGMGKTNIERNLLYHFYNNAPANRLGCVGMSPTQDPGVAAIVIDNQAGTDPSLDGDVLVANNMITFQVTSVMASGYAVYNGILVPSQMTRTVKIFHNSVFIYGVDNQAQGRNFVFYRRGTAPTRVTNNIFLNTRETDNPNFIIGASSGGINSDYNLIFQKTGSSLRDFGFYGPGGEPDDSNDAARFADTCQEWQRISRQDTNSLCVNVEDFFVDPSVGNLRILQTLENPVVDAGRTIGEVKTDIDLILRVEPDIGASEAFNAWIGVVSTNWFDARNWSTGKVPSCQEYNLIIILPPGALLPRHTVNSRDVETVIYQPVLQSGAVDRPSVYRNLIIQEKATVTIGSADAHLYQCSEQKPLKEGILNQGTIAFTHPGRLTLNGVLNNEGTINAPTGTFILGGTERQNINSTKPMQFWNLSVEGGGRKVMRKAVVVTNAFHLGNGIYQAFPPNTLTLDVNAVVTGTPAVGTHVVGRMIKRFSGPNQEFFYPIGVEDRLGPIAIRTSESETAQYPVSFAAQYYVRGANIPGDIPPTDLLHEDVSYVSNFDVWRVSRLGGGMSDASVALYYHSETGIKDVNDAEVVRWETTNPGPGWTMAGESELQENIPPGYGPRLMSDPVQQFTFFALGIRKPDAPLPVELVSFTAQVQKQDVQLAWETSMEKNSSHFNVQRSLDGSSYQTLGKVAAAGNSLEHIKYAFVDKGIGREQAGRIYYRLEQVDIDGATEYSPVVAVLLADQAFAITSVYPNPFTDKLELKLAGSKTQQLEIRLINVEGRQVFSRQVSVKGGETISPLLNVAQLQAGIYILEVRSADLIKQFKVIKH